jgi:hypothetical protein
LQTVIELTFVYEVNSLNGDENMSIQYATGGRHFTATLPEQVKLIIDQLVLGLATGSTAMKVENA